ncbi:MAG: hypothetical protein HN742_16125 [Lentisphaerae bacterium]|jgi:hypothetical protein|nr:hypothetical protein [Lentisphaerota bacterium]MBT4815766.1 hypothetical protein [Lentisphaerota bacterium]MBT5604817.1 hypothetical protein [Lentisphaerota bacterium]MBT7053568.1 hypothetical protein [Lentisphaerota bacterium]MBT7843405.1 hypothetical protein [Lentisphaerota bacterium]
MTPYSQVASTLLRFTIGIFLVVLVSRPAAVGAAQTPSISTSFDAGSGRLKVIVGDRAFEPLRGAGPILLTESGPILPKGQTVSLLGTEERPDGTLVCHYQGTVGETSARFTLELTGSIGDGTVMEFRLRWHSPQRVWAGVSPGVAIGGGRRQPFFFNRVSESYGQASGGCTFHCAGVGVWLHADWDVPVSNLSTCNKQRTIKPAEINTNFPVDLTQDEIAAGNVPFPIAATSDYAPNTAGQRLPLDDTLILRVGHDLWDTVPTPPQASSPYRDELSRSAFLDIWGGHRASQLTHMIGLMGRIVRDRVRFHSILQNWQCGGFDTLQPLSLRMPDYPPNPHVGTVAELRELTETGKRFGRFGFRTNYVYAKPKSPVVVSGEARLSVNSDGSPRRFARFHDIIRLAHRQEAEISALFGANATFSDQLGSAGDCSLYTNYDAETGAPALRQTWAQIKGVCEFLRSAHNGPLSSETLCGDFLLGAWIDAGDYGMFGGNTRALAPDYKLRKLQHLTTFHGMALGYRFFFAPPYGGNDHHQRGDAMYREAGTPADDYRACEVLYGNGAYLYLTSGTRWQHILSEIVIMGRLQQQYALVPVHAIEYYQRDTEKWVDLEALAKSGVNVTPVRWIPQTTTTQIARVRYVNGLEVVVNRSPEPFNAACGNLRTTLPQSGWCAALPNGEFEAYSAWKPGTSERIDHLVDKAVGWEFTDPRDCPDLEVKHPTLKVDARTVVELLPGDRLRIDGEIIPGHLPAPPPLTAIDTDFHQGPQRWHAARDIVRLQQKSDAIALTLCGHDPYIIGPQLDVPGDAVRTLIVTMRTPQAGKAAIFWKTKAEPAFRPGAMKTFPVVAGDVFRTYRIDMHSHSAWKGQMITGLRFDPLAHESDTVVEIQSIRGE